MIKLESKRLITLFSTILWGVLEGYAVGQYDYLSPKGRIIVCGAYGLLFIISAAMCKYYYSVEEEKPKKLEAKNDVK